MKPLGQMTAAEWARFEAMHAFAGAIAFANLDLRSKEARWEAQVFTDHRDVRHRLRVSCHLRWPEEVGRALRLPKERRALKAEAGPPQLRPLELLEREDPIDRQFHMQSLLINIITSNHRAVVTSLGLLTVDVQANVGTAGDGWKPSRKWPHRLHVNMTYMAPLGYDSLRYAVMLAGEAKLFHRLGRCLTCRRFILGKTDKPVQYCADVECQPAGSRARGEVRTAGAEYKRRLRERQRRWALHSGELRTALKGSPTPRKLALLIRQGRKLVEKCFRWAESGARKDAELVLAQAEDRLTALKRAARSASRAPGALRR